MVMCPAVSSFPGIAANSRGSDSSCGILSRHSRQTRAKPARLPLQLLSTTAGPDERMALRTAHAVTTRLVRG